MLLIQFVSIYKVPITILSLYFGQKKIILSCNTLSVGTYVFSPRGKISSQNRLSSKYFETMIFFVHLNSETFVQTVKMALTYAFSDQIVGIIVKLSVLITGIY